MPRWVLMGKSAVKRAAAISEKAAARCVRPLDPDSGGVSTLGVNELPSRTPQTKMTPVPIDAVRQRLLRLREELKARQGRAERDLRHGAEPLVADAPDQAIQLQNDEVLREIDSAALVEVAQIDAALSRLENGLYGACSRCQEAIDPRRLAAVPYAVTCMKCAG